MKFNKNIAIGVLALCVFSACNQKEKTVVVNRITANEEADISFSKDNIVFTSEQYELAGIKTGTVEKRNISNVVKLNGVIEVKPEGMATLSAPLGGYLKTAGLTPGEAVKKGQVLATIENPDFITMQQDYLESIGAFEFVKSEFERQKKLRDEDVNAVKTFQKISSEYQILEAKIKGLKQQLALAGINLTALKKDNILRTANLYAPISGYVKASNVNIGNYVNPDDVLFEIINPDKVQIALNTFEKDIEFVQEGQTVRFSLASENDFHHSANISLIGKTTGKDGIIPVRGEIVTSVHNGLLAGMYIKAFIEKSTNNQNAVPSEAIVQLNGKDYLVVEKSNSKASYTYALAQVKKEVVQDGFTSVILPKSVKPGISKIVVKNAYAVLSALINSEEE